MSSEIPYRKGMKCPGPAYMLAKVVEEDGTTRTAWIKASSAKTGPVQQELPKALLPVVLWTWKHLRQHIHWCRTLEDWELGFMRDVNFGSEIVVWAMSTYLFLEFMHRHPAADRKSVFHAVCGMSVGQETLIRPKAVMRELKKILTSRPRTLADPKNFTPDGRFTAGPKYLE
jgi:hypothetical protein